MLVCACVCVYALVYVSMACLSVYLTYIGKCAHYTNDVCGGMFVFIVRMCMKWCECKYSFIYISIMYACCMQLRLD